MRARFRSGRIRDEVYRQMFRLEAKRFGAEMELAMALLRAWMASCSRPQGAKEKPWLKKISPICLQMIESALRADNAAIHCPECDSSSSA
jgi:hypothetical protein